MKNDANRYLMNRLDRFYQKACSVIPILFFPLVPVSCEKGISENEVTPPGPVLSETAFRFDRYSGTTVRSQEQAESLIVSRYGNAPTKGEIAPNLPMIAAKTDSTTRLHDIITDKPAVVILGSCSCSHVDLYYEDFERLSVQYSDHFDFHFIYIREAHAEGGFLPRMERNGQPLNLKPLPDATTLQHRKKQAATLPSQLGDQFQIWVDSMDDEWAVRWSAWPGRAFVVGTDKKVIYCGGPGPFYFQVSKEGWHQPPPEFLETLFRRVPFDDFSLEEFLEETSR